MNLNNFRVKFFLLVFGLFILYGCEKDINESPVLNFSNIINGLEVTLTGSATDSNGAITVVQIDWGDNSSLEFINNHFDNFSTSHNYDKPETYTITVSIKDDSGAVLTDTVHVVLDFKETSLNGIKESLFKVLDDEYLILTINLHTYQEVKQNEKFNLITDIIGMMDIDFIAFQECAQNKSARIVDGIIREDNMALIITERLQEKYDLNYNFVWNWSHYGWTVWEEGVAILSKYTVVNFDDRYVSSTSNTSSIESRKVIYGSFQIPDLGFINLFSAHLHWRTSLTSEEQNNQIKNVKLMLDEKESLVSGMEVISFVCGDFNGNPTSEYPWSEGYNTMMRNGDFTDTFLEIYPFANTTPAQSSYNTIGGDFPGRIDYIFMKNNSNFKVVDSQIIFTSEVVGKVSDHYGVLTKVKFIK